MTGLALAETYQASPIKSAALLIETIGVVSTTPTSRAYSSNRLDPLAKPAILAVSVRSSVANSAAWCSEIEGVVETTPSRSKRSASRFSKKMKEVGVVETTPTISAIHRCRGALFSKLRARVTLKRHPWFRSIQPHRYQLVVGLVEVMTREGGRA